MLDKAETPKAANHGMILIVEQDDALRAGIADLFRVEGFGVQMAAGVPEALEHISERCPDAAIIDIHLPNDGGVVLVNNMRTHLGDDLPIVVLSQDGESRGRQGLVSNGVTYHLRKPVSASVLMTCLSALVKTYVNKVAGK